MWNTDKPPGRIDPYSPSSPFREEVEGLDEAAQKGDRGLQEARRDEDILSQSESVRDGYGDVTTGVMRKQMPVENSVYVPAETVEGLEWLGSPRWKVRRRKIYKEKLREMPKWGV